LYDVSKEKPGTQIVIWAGRALSGTPALTIYNSREAADSHSRLGFSARRQLVIPNGFDCGRFVPNFAARNRIRQELAIPEDHLVIGHVARYHPVKGHQLLIDAIASLAEVALPMTFLLIGSGVDANNVELAAALRRTGIGSRVKLLGPRTDMPNLTAAFDLAVLSSEAESFPNVVAEAMACEIPVIATHVGDCADIIGDSGVVCPVGDAIALSSGIKLLAGRSADERREMGKRARARIEARYSLDSVAQRYWEVYSSVSTVPRKQLATLSLN
jgi:glycosyltransferase involved in cell wall biosynthesis